MNRLDAYHEQPDLMTFEEALLYFRVSRQTLLNALRSGEVVGFKIGAQWRIPRYIPRSILQPSSEKLRISGAQVESRFRG